MKIETALISVYHKEGLDAVIESLSKRGVQIISTGGTKKYIEERGVAVRAVEDLTGYPSILDGRVKTLHPGVFGGILARRTEDHLEQLKEYNIAAVDLVIVDLYPFEETVKNTTNESEIIEKIDIGGISLIRAAAKNHESIMVVSSRDQYSSLVKLLEDQNGETTLEQRQAFAREAFYESSRQDIRIVEFMDRYFDEHQKLRVAYDDRKELRYGENPHQKAVFYGDLDELFEQIHGKALSYNNLIDVDAAISLIAEFEGANPTFGVIKHTNCCGLATRDNTLEAWQCALAGDPISAFGGIYVSNTMIDEATATDMHKMFFEVVMAPSFSKEALNILKKKKNRVILKLHKASFSGQLYKRVLNGVISQERDGVTETADHLKIATKTAPSTEEISDLLFANISVKHLKSNAISIVKNKQLLGMGCGQTSRVDALKQAILKANSFGFDLKGAVVASDAFFPFKDCVEIAHEAGIQSFVQPGGSIRDAESIEVCDLHEMSMALTGKRHFKH